MARPSVPAPVRAAAGTRQAPVRGATALAVDQVRLTLPNMPAERAQRVVRRALELVLEGLPAGLRGHVAGLALKVELPASGASEQAQSEALSRAILRALPGVAASRTLSTHRASHG